MTTAAPPSPALPSELRMPSLGADMDHGTLVRWRIAMGAAVRRGEIVAEVETEKGVFEMEATSAGVVTELLVTPGTRVKVGTPLARLGGAAAATAQAVVAPSAAPTTAAPVASVPSAPPETARPAPTVEAATPPPVTMPPRVAEGAPPIVAVPAAPRRRVSPAARRLAESRGVELARVDGTGPEHAILLADVKRVIETVAALASSEVALSATVALAAPIAAPDRAAAPARAMRQAVAAAVSRSKREIPHYYLSQEIDLSTALAWLAGANAARPITERILPAALLLKSVALALREHRELNGIWAEGELHLGVAINLGVAVSLRGGGLIAPAIHDADTLPLDALMRATADLVRRARTGGLRTSEMTDATITVSSLGDDGVTTMFGVIYPPQVALVGFGGIAERPWAERGMLGVRPTVTISLAADHRATDGHYGSRFLRTVARLLHAPETL